LVPDRALKSARAPTARETSGRGGKGREERGSDMTDHVYKQIELTGSSSTGIEEAIRNAIARASKTLRNLHWFQVVETRGNVENGRIAYWQVTIKAGFTLEE
jgi:flavin-binding protein dodecin